MSLLAKVRRAVTGQEAFPHLFTSGGCWIYVPRIASASGVEISKSDPGHSCIRSTLFMSCWRNVCLESLRNDLFGLLIRDTQSPKRANLLYGSADLPLRDGFATGASRPARPAWVEDRAPLAPLVEVRAERASSDVLRPSKRPFLAAEHSAPIRLTGAWTRRGPYRRPGSG